MPEKTSEGTSVPSLTFTDEAVQKLNEVIAQNPKSVAGLRLQIIGRGEGQFQHVLSIVEIGSENAEDVAVDSNGLHVFIPPEDAKYVDGLKVNYRYKGPNISGLEYENPNPLWLDEREVEIQRLFDEEINPAIAAHGGWVSLLGVEGTTAFVELGGGCQGCGMADVTLKQGIEAAILETVDGIERVVDKTDHASGTNPYYQPSKK